ncbi:MAG: HAMP domain-containing histidine kinase [Clostridia bacterium]|jgi:signal transduction histidine kinase|nr:HAMP domain-containing histidine kinase [Clostridia bacterium]
MKFGVKIIISVIAIITIIFSIAGIIIIKSNFEHSLEKIINQNIESHNLERYGIENNIDSNIDKNGNISKENLSSYAISFVSYLANSKKISIYIENEKVYSNFDIDEESLAFFNDSKEVKYIIKEIDNLKYMLVSSSVEINNQRITLISRYDITDIFIERDRQVAFFYKVDISVIITVSIVICVLTVFLTRPIRKLNEMSKKITKGSYHERVNIKSNDEIGELTISFNQMIETIENKIKELELSVKRKEEFITNFTHELKNPMTSIIGYADILRSGKYDKETDIKSANYIFNEAKRLEILAHKLMDLMELSNENIKLEKIDVVCFMNKLYKDIHESLEYIELKLEIEDGCIIADKVLLEDCLRNLIDNSKKANPKDKMIKVLGKNEKNKYKISVEDKGCGIPKEDIPRVLESFYMVDKARARDSGRNGIGLSICQKIANLHNTRLIIESELNKGTCVSFYLEVGNVEE